MPYVLEPHWANWMLVLEMFIAGVAAGTIFVIALLNLGARRGTRAGDEDHEVAARLGFIPLPLMLVVAVLLIADLGEPTRFLNLVLRSAAAPERGPGPLMFNANSPMNWGTYVILIFGALTVVPFVDALKHTGRWRLRTDLIDAVAHNPIFMAVCGFFALATGTYSGVLLNVTSQNVWSDTILVGVMYMVFSALSGVAVAAIVADRMGATRTAQGVRQALLWFAAIAGVLVLVFVVNLAAVGRALPLVGTFEQLVAPIFWLGVVGLAILFPIIVMSRRGTLALGRVDLTDLAVVGTLVLVGVLAFRYALLYSALAALP